MKPGENSIRTLRAQRGISLIELMISLTIGLFLLAGLVTVYVNSAQSSSELEKSAQQIENGRFAMQTITDDLRHAGFYGQYYTALLPTAPGLPDPCDWGSTGVPFASIRDALLLPIQGYNGWDAALSACLPAANHKSGTDILVIRRADSNATAAGNFEVGRLYVQASASSVELNNPLVRAATSSGGTLGVGETFYLVDRTTLPAPVRKLHVHIYFVSPCSKPLVCTGGATDDGVPTLKRLELVNGGFSVVPIAEGIENLQFDYGVDADPAPPPTPPNPAGTVGGDGAPEAPFVVNPPTPQAWANVVAVKVSLLARSREASPGYTDDKTYQLGDFVSWTPSGAARQFKRHAYSEVARIVNVSGRREAP
jgi:type IV pilus assembly protein PilW